MRNAFLIGVDIGTQGTKASLYDADGTALSHASEPSRLIVKRPGEAEQDPDEIFTSVIRTIKQAVEAAGVSPSEIAGIGIDAQMAGIMGIDRDWNAVTPYDSWLDTKCEPYIAAMKQAGEDRIISVTGGQVTYSHGPKILWWKEKEPRIYGRIARFVVPSVYAAGRLCGLRSDQAYIDYTHLHFTGFADTGKLAWDKELLDTFAVGADKLPRICSPCEIIGGLTKEAARACGLREGTPVAAGCGDSAASSLGAGITEPGMIYDVAGTASVFSCSTAEFRPDRKHKTILYARSVIEGLWIPLAYISGGGLCIRWFRDLMRLSYDELQELSEAVEPGCEELSFVPHFSGRTCPNRPAVRGAFVGLGTNHSAGHMYRSILESIAYEYRLYLSILQESGLGDSIRGIYGVGGGTGSALLNQIKADVLEAPYIAMKNREAATFGSAVIAGYATGIYSGLQFAKEKQEAAGHFYPDPAKSRRYRGRASDYGEILNKMDRLYREREPD